MQSDSNDIGRERDIFQGNTKGSRFSQATLSSLKFPPKDIKIIHEWTKKFRNILVILGPPGVGKTHLCYALLNDLSKMRYIFSKRLWKERDLLTRVRSEMDLPGDYLERMKFLIDDELIILDDVASSGITDWRKDVLLGFLDQRYESELPTIITSNLSKESILETFGDRFHSRLFAKENTIIQISGPDLRQS